MVYNGIKRNTEVFIIHKNQIRSGLITEIQLNLNSHKVTVQLSDNTDMSFRPIYVSVPINEVFIDRISALSWQRTWHLKEAEKLKQEIQKELSC